MKLRLRAVEPEDVDFMYECEEDAEAVRWSDYPAPFSRRQLLEYAISYDADPYRAGQLRLIITADGERVGMADLYEISTSDRRAFSAIFIHPRYRRKGIGSKALEAIAEYSAKRLGLRMLAAKVSTENPAALATYLKGGFMRRALLPAWHRFGDTFHDIELLTLEL